MSEQQGDYLTQEEIEEGMALLRGDEIIQFEKPQDTIIETEDGFEAVQSLGWVKFSAAFRNNMLRRLKGAKLAIFIAICLHLNENGEAFPGIDLIAEETGYHRDTVMLEITELEKIPGLLTVVRERGKSNKYRPAFVARGAKNEPPEPVGKIRPVGQPVEETSTTSAKTSRGNLDSKKSIKNKKTLSARQKDTPALEMFRGYFGKFLSERELFRWLTIFEATGKDQADELASWAFKKEIHLTNRGGLLDSLETAAKNWHRKDASAPEQINRPEYRKFVPKEEPHAIPNPFQKPRIATN